MQPAKINYKIYQGSTFQETFRWESETKVYVPIQAIAKSAPCVITTTSVHQLPLGWRFRVVGAGGMKEINSVGEDSYHLSTLIPTPTTVEINQVNSLNYTTYTSGGVVEFNQPVSLTGFAARMQIRETVDSTTVIHEATTQNAQIVLDNVNKTIQITLLANVTQNFTFSTAVYSLELYSGNNVIPFINGNLTLVQEVTR
jgi:hypothetical protein